MSRKSRLSKEISKKNIQVRPEIKPESKIEEESKLKVHDTFDINQQYQLSIDLLMISTMNNL